MGFGVRAWRSAEAQWICPETPLYRPVPLVSESAPDSEEMAKLLIAPVCSARTLAPQTARRVQSGLDLYLVPVFGIDGTPEGCS